MILELLNGLILVVRTIKSKLSSLLISHPKSHIVSHEDLLKLFKQIHHIGKLPLLYRLAVFFNEVLRNQLICVADLAYPEARSLINTCYQLIELLPNTLISHDLLLALRNPLSQMLGRMDISGEQAAVVSKLLEQIRSGSADAYYKFEQKIARRAENRAIGSDSAEVFYVLAEILKIFEDCDSVEQQLTVSCVFLRVVAHISLNA